MANFIIDTDTASDDAVALLLALNDPSCNVIGITTVFGNIGVEQATQNALISLEMANMPQIPVFKGVGKPLVRDQINATHVHGNDGLGDMGYTTNLKAQDLHAVNAMIQMVEESTDNIEIITLGPLTNIAVAISKAPETMKKVTRISIMGGAQLGYNAANETAEFNILCDPEAAHIVFSSGIDILMVPLEVCLGGLEDKRATTEFFDEDIAVLRALKTKKADFTVDCNRVLYDHNKNKYKNGFISMPDPTAVAAALRPGMILESFRTNVRVDISGSKTYGQTVLTAVGGSAPIDEETDRNTKFSNATVVCKLDGKQFKDYVINAMKED